MDRSVPLAAMAIGLLGALLAPRFGPTAAFPPPVSFLVCTLGAFAGLWAVSSALGFEAQR